MSKVIEDIKMNNFLLKIAETQDEKDAAFSLRYQVFFEEEGYKSDNPEVEAKKMDFDMYDEHCHHLIMLDTDAGSTPAEQLIGAYRMITKEQAEKVGYYYTKTEFDTTFFEQTEDNALEMGRACVKPEYRNQTSMNLLWNGIASYVLKYNIRYMFGMASFANVTDPAQIADELSFFYHFNRAPEHMRSVKPMPMAGYYQDGMMPYKAMDWDELKDVIIPKEQLDFRKALQKIPPIFKGYARLGCAYSEGISIDTQFNVISLVTLFDFETIDPKYKKHFLKK